MVLCETAVMRLDASLPRPRSMEIFSRPEAMPEHSPTVARQRSPQRMVFVSMRRAQPRGPERSSLFSGRRPKTDSVAFKIPMDRGPWSIERRLRKPQATS